ncbi:MAG: hypothetical protein ACYS29_06430 [Planctomycetota bacterium]
MVLRMVLWSVCSTIVRFSRADNYRPGLAGTSFEGEEFTRPEAETHYLLGVDND